MIKKTISYTDYDGVDRKEDFYFNISKSELTKMNANVEGGLEKLITQIIDAKDGKRIMELFDDLIYRSYGVKTPDGKRFIKSKEVKDAFVESEAYEVLFEELCTDADKAAEFVNGILPKNLSAKAANIDNKPNVEVVK